PLAEGGFVFRRTLVLAGALALVFATAATAADVKIRVEGKTHTIFAPAEHHVTADNALQALEQAAAAGAFFVDVKQTADGPYVDQVGLFQAFGSSGWTYKVNGVSPPVGADQYSLKPADHVLWYWATFSQAGGPPTLELDHQHGNCYRVFAVDDTGAKSDAD